MNYDFLKGKCCDIHYGTQVVCVRVCACVCEDYRAATVCLPAALPPLPMNWCRLEDKGLPSDALLSVCLLAGGAAEPPPSPEGERDCYAGARSAHAEHIHRVWMSSCCVPSCKQASDIQNLGSRLQHWRLPSHGKVQFSVAPRVRPPAILRAH